MDNKSFVVSATAFVNGMTITIENGMIIREEKAKKCKRITSIRTISRVPVKRKQPMLIQLDTPQKPWRRGSMLIDFGTPVPVKC